MGGRRADCLGSAEQHEGGMSWGYDWCLLFLGGTEVALGGWVREGWYGAFVGGMAWGKGVGVFFLVT